MQRIVQVTGRCTRHKLIAGLFRNTKYNNKFSLSKEGAAFVYGMLPLIGIILRPQMFGAIKYNGQWRGVRFTE